MPRARNLLIILVSLTLFIIIFNNARFSDDFLEDYDEIGNNKYELKNLSTITAQTHRYVTPSLAELGMPSVINKHLLMLTRVPDAGAEILTLILQRLQSYNVFKHIRLPPGDSGILTSIQQELLVEEITGIIRQEAIPLSFDGNVRFLNFSQFGRQAPMFISMVRNPLDIKNFQWKNVSANYSGAISYFCGQDPRCAKRNSRWPLERAKKNVKKWYRVVGILENMEETLDKLENTFPYFFHGAKDVYKKILEKHKKRIDHSVRLKFGRNFGQILTDEVEFYLWLKSRLLNGTCDNG